MLKSDVGKFLIPYIGIFLRREVFNENDSKKMSYLTRSHIFAICLNRNWESNFSDFNEVANLQPKFNPR